jgi:hypothetical protein
MRRTLGHIEHYLTHTLCFTKGCADAPGDADAAVAPELQRATNNLGHVQCAETVS